MDLDFSQYPELDGPIVLLIGGGHGDADRLKERLYNVLVLEANVQTVELIHLNLESYWWDDPRLHDKMHELLDLFPRKSKASASKWIETDGFVREIRKLLTRSIEGSMSLERLPKNWPELVSLVILDVDTETDYVRRVFDGWFPNAKFRAYSGRDHTVEIWRNAEVVSIEQATKPTAAEAIRMKVRELPGLDATTISKLENNGDPSVYWTVRRGREWLREKCGLLKVDLDQIGGALADVNLAYSLTDGEITASTGEKSPYQALAAASAVINSDVQRVLILDPRILRTFERLGIQIIKDLVVKTEQELVKELGSGFTLEVQLQLEKHHLSLGMDELAVVAVLEMAEAS